VVVGGGVVALAWNFIIRSSSASFMAFCRAAICVCGCVWGGGRGWNECAGRGQGARATGSPFWGGSHPILFLFERQTRPPRLFGTPPWAARPPPLPPNARQLSDKCTLHLVVAG
jgi:hypothetical protein